MDNNSLNEFYNLISKIKTYCINNDTDNLQNIIQLFRKNNYTFNHINNFKYMSDRNFRQYIKDVKTNNNKEYINTFFSNNIKEQSGYNKIYNFDLILNKHKLIIENIGFNIAINLLISIATKKLSNIKKYNKQSKININTIDNYLIIINKWLLENKIGKTKEKVKDISKNIFWCVFDNKLNINDIIYIIKYIKINNFIFKEGPILGNIENYLKTNKYNNFFYDIFKTTPIGLYKSPNSCCGKGELLYRLMRPNSRQSNNNNDIIDNNKKIEIKGNQIRFFSQNITGKEYRIIVEKIFSNIINGNLIKCGKLKGQFAYEIEKKQYRGRRKRKRNKVSPLYYKEEFKKITYKKRVILFYKLLKKLNISGNCLKLSKKICNNGYNQKIYQKILLFDWFKKYQNKNNFDELIIMGNCENIKLIKNLNDVKNLIIYSDYFRINQNTLIGWYVK
jgi:hypothetical protein